MGTKDTVMSKEPCINCSNKQVDKYGYLCDLSCGKRTAWLNYRAGIREVVEWMEKNRYSTSWNNVTFRVPIEEWQAKLKEWGID